MTETRPMLSRVADSLYWMSRYLERAENTARLLDVHMNSTLDMASGLVEAERTQRLLTSLNVPSYDETQNLSQMLTFDTNNPASIIALIASARENARQVREQLSSEMWTQINKVYLQAKSADSTEILATAPHDYYLAVQEGSHLFQGITAATMNRSQGWHFIQIGRYVERSMALIELLDVHFRDAQLTIHDDIPTQHYFELIETLKSVTAFEAYTKVYSPNVQTVWVVEFLLFNSEFPHSLSFCVNLVEQSLNALAEMTGRTRNTQLQRMTGRLQSQLRYDEVRDIQSLHEYLMNIRQQIYRIHDTVYATYITYPIETAL